MHVQCQTEYVIKRDTDSEPVFHQHQRVPGERTKTCECVNALKTLMLITLSE